MQVLRKLDRQDKLDIHMQVMHKLGNLVILCLQQVEEHMIHLGHIKQGQVQRNCKSKVKQAFVGPPIIQRVRQFKLVELKLVRLKLVRLKLVRLKPVELKLAELKQVEVKLFKFISHMLSILLLEQFFKLEHIQFMFHKSLEECTQFGIQQGNSQLRISIQEPRFRRFPSHTQQLVFSIQRTLFLILLRWVIIEQPLAKLEQALVKQEQVERQLVTQPLIRLEQSKLGVIIRGMEQLQK